MSQHDHHPPHHGHGHGQAHAAAAHSCCSGPANASTHTVKDRCVG